MDDKELDSWLALNVMKWERATNHWVEDCKLRFAFDSWRPTKSVSYAVRVVREMRKLYPLWHVELLWHAGGGITATVYESTKGYVVCGRAKGDDTEEALAICLAIKRAIKNTGCPVPASERRQDA